LECEKVYIFCYSKVGPSPTEMSRTRHFCFIQKIWDLQRSKIRINFQKKIDVLLWGFRKMILKGVPVGWVLVSKVKWILCVLSSGAYPNCRNLKFWFWNPWMANKKYKKFHLPPSRRFRYGVTFLAPLWRATTFRSLLIKIYSTSVFHTSFHMERNGNGMDAREKFSSYVYWGVETSQGWSPS